ncbi:hypothetical protein AG1IA_04964 [Rhizoctonia solani AG-1 IA]|uniref:C3H1-type domain-containing protein n=1 Tax=Thanatephorus cucumeris (strain AG1-IA) TaxID=983506 RepID=L8WSP9_THACA|nr:hypothetical protein AG1IA_04964 [Rhizoctonia solani AG-1 IA]
MGGIELQDVAGALQDSKLPSTFCFILNRARDFDGLEAAASDSSWAMYADVAKRAGVGKVERKQLCALLGLCQNIKLTPTGQVVRSNYTTSHLTWNVSACAQTHYPLLAVGYHCQHLGIYGCIRHPTTWIFYRPKCIATLWRGSCQLAIDQYEPSDEDEESGLLGKEVEEFSNRVATLCRVCQILMASDPEDLESGGTGFSISAPCALGCLKTLVLLTSDLPHQSSQDAEPGTSQVAASVARNPLNFHIITHFVAKGGDPSTQSTQFEHACLGLALLLNLVKEDSVGVKQVRRIYSSCPLNRKCSTECQCKNRKPLLNLYVGMYGQLQNESALQADFHATFLAGYLAVLLGLLVVNDESVKDGVYEELPGPAGSNKFEDLAQSIEQFVHAYEKVAQATKIRTNRDEEDDDNNDDNEDKEVGGGDAGSGIALGVGDYKRHGPRITCTWLFSLQLTTSTRFKTSKMDSLPKRPNTPPSPPRRGSRHVSPPTAQRPGPSSWEPPRPRSPGVWDRDRGRPIYRPRSRSRSRSYDYNYDFPRRRTPPPPHPHPHSRLPRRAWERSRSRSPQPPKSSVPCKYYSRPTGCDKGNRCRFRHEGPRSRSFTRSRSRTRSPPRSPRSRSPPLRYRGDSPMLVPRGGMRSPQPSLLQRLGPVAPISPMRGRTTNDPNEPLEEGEERSPGRRSGRSRGRARRRPDRKGNWDSFVADEDEEMSDYEGRDSKRGYDPRRGKYLWLGDLFPILPGGKPRADCLQFLGFEHAANLTLSIN